MKGTNEGVFSPLPRYISFEDLLPLNDIYRRLEKELALSFTRNLVLLFCAKGGRPSVDPVVSFELFPRLTKIHENLGNVDRAQAPSKQIACKQEPPEVAPGRRR